MKKFITIIIALLFFVGHSQAPSPFQYGIKTPLVFPWQGTNKIDFRCRLKLDTTAGGFIPASMTTTQKLAISSPQIGESVYDVTLGKYYHWDGSAWVISGGGSVPNLASILAVDNKTNEIPIVSNDGTSSLNVDNSGNIYLVSNFTNLRQLIISEDAFYFSSPTRFVFSGKGIDMNNNSDGLGLPRLTTTQMNAIAYPTEGMIVRNITEHLLYQYNGTSWEPLATSSTPTLTETQIAVGQTGDVIGSSGNLTFDGNSSLRIVAPSSPTGGITVSDGYINPDNVGLYSLSSDKTIADYSPATTIYKYSNGNYNYDESITTHNFVGTVKIGGVEPLTTSTGALSSHTHTFASLTSKPTTLTGYGITDAYPSSGNPSGFLTNVSSSDIVNGTIVNADINSSAGIDATKINTGAVSNTEYNYLDGVTSGIQTQIDTFNTSTGLTFSGPVNLSVKGGAYYVDHTQTGTITFSVSASSIGCSAFLNIIANGNPINLVGTWKNVGSESVSTTSGAVNRIVMFVVNSEVWYSVKVN